MIKMIKMIKKLLHRHKYELVCSKTATNTDYCFYKCKKCLKTKPL